MKRNATYLMLLTMFLLPFLPGAIQATGCRVAFAHKQAVIVEKVAVVAAAALVVPVVTQYAVPLYGATYNPYAYPAPPPVQQAPQYAPHAAPCGELSATVKALAEELRALKSQLRPTMPPAPDNGGAVDPFAPQAQQQQAPQDSVSRILSARCSSCHDDSRSKAAGKGITLTIGGKAKTFSPEELGAIIGAVSSRSMPKGAPMPDAERIELIAALAGGGR